MIYVFIQDVSDTPVADSGGVVHVSETPDDSDAEDFASSLIVSPNIVPDFDDKVGLF